MAASLGRNHVQPNSRLTNSIEQQCPSWAGKRERRCQAPSRRMSSAVLAATLGDASKGVRLRGAAARCSPAVPLEAWLRWAPRAPRAQEAPPLEDSWCTLTGEERERRKGKLQVDGSKLEGFTDAAPNLGCVCVS